MSKITIRPVEALMLSNLRPLLDESLVEGYGFVQKLWDDYESGKNRFDTGGAILLGVFDDDHLVGVGGVQGDPYLKRADVGRIRHVYILHAYRRQGVGKRLLEELIQHAQAHFSLLTLRTQTQSAAAFYVASGFDDQPVFPEATHFLRL